MPARHLMLLLLLSSTVGLFVGCLGGSGSESSCRAGSQYCPCLQGICEVGLVCINDFCLMPGAGETGDDNSGDGDGDTGDGDGDGDTGDGDGDSGDGDGDGDTGDGDGDTGDGDGDTNTDTNCPPGQFGCPCDAGECDPGLYCDPDTDECMLGGGDGDGDGDGDDPWDPNSCMPPSEPLEIQDIAGAMCSAPCTIDADCPPGPNGTNPACALAVEGMDADHCALVCAPMQDACPVGSSCKDVPLQPGVGICTYP